MRERSETRILNCIRWPAIAVALAVAASTPCRAADPIRGDLTKLYRKYPALRTNMRPEVVGEVATEVLGKKKAKRLVEYMTGHIDEFQTLRMSVLDDLGKYGAKLHAVVSGQSVTGMAAAAILARSGYSVDVYEMRDAYVRNIQWAGRQALVDELASIDPKLADRFLERVAHDLERGSIHLSSDGSRKHYDQSGVKRGDPTRVPTSGTELMKEPSLVNMEARVFEETMQEYLNGLPNIHRHTGSITLGPPDGRGMYSVQGHGTPDLIMLAEGTGGKTKDLLDITSAPTSPKRLQVAGVVYIDGGGVMAKKWREEANDVLLTGTMSKKGSGKTWVVADIDPAKIQPAPAFGTDVKAPAYVAERQRLVDAEFRRLAAETMEVPLETVNHAKIEGAIQGRNVETFELQQKISSKATAGKNVVGFADVVGNNHWSVGGGMQTGVVGHGERFKTLLLDLERGRDRTDALQKYSDGVFDDTRAWGEIGINDFYPNLDRTTSKRAFNESVSLWKKNRLPSPERGLQLMMPEGNLAKTLKPLKLKCDEIILRVLGDK